ncbi:DNA internalization-related competence protein ComEC/Rec2 [Thioploca ingrica]|uniref:DNA internalization-related competence protein ComEC/Rec2 n=1 Tax=Thioploca ingrica TaxID=40754 RepID=A0A090BU51_9GAMM|nr:DNA internalization-related competence protein ComEC/Rec2 [Thioploca ingrica]
MRFNTLAFLVGIVYGQTWSHLPDPRWTILLLPVVLIAWKRPSLRLLCFGALGLGWTVWRANMILAQNLPRDLESKDLKLTGVVVNIPIKKAYGWQFDFGPNPTQEWPNPGRLRLQWYEQPLEPLIPGQHWQLTVRLKPTQSLLNPGGFDYSSWLFQQQIRATGYVSLRSQPQLLQQPASLLNIDHWRYQLAKAIQQQLHHSPTQGIIIGLVIGEAQWITPRQQTVFKQTGTTHLIVISGSHISLVALLVFEITLRFWRYLGKPTLWLPAPYFAAVWGLLAAGFYALLAGFMVPTQRALIMLVVALSGILFTRRVMPSSILAFSLLIVLLWDPLAVLSLGFWLSFGAVAVIVYVLTNRRELKTSVLLKWGLDSWRTQIAVSLLVAIIFLAQFGYTPLSSLVANSIAIPWFGLVIVPLALFGAALVKLLPIIGGSALQLADYFMDALWVSLEWLANPHWMWYQAIPPWWAIVSALVGMLVLLLPRGFPAKWIGIIWLLPLFLTRTPYPQRGEVWFTLLDVGQGLAAVIRTQNYTLVYDTGAKWNDNSDIGQTVVVPFLRTQGIREIDKLLISHGDNDHIGGAQSLLKNLTVTEVITSVPEKFTQTNPVRLCQAGQYWRWDDVDFKILHPPAHYLANGNSRSCVLKIITAGGSLLLPGDIETAAESDLLNHAYSDLAADILIVPHHGSQTSSTEAFIQAVKPKIALFSVAYKNRFRLPNPEIVQRYHRYGIKTWTTASVGAIQFRLSASGISQPQLEKIARHRYWYD